jgi:hypothetical protein
MEVGIKQCPSGNGPLVQSFCLLAGLLHGQANWQCTTLRKPLILLFLDKIFHFRPGNLAVRIRRFRMETRLMMNCTLLWSNGPHEIAPQTAYIFVEKLLWTKVKKDYKKLFIRQSSDHCFFQN